MAPFGFPCWSLVELALLAFGIVSGTLGIPVGLMWHLADVQVMVRLYWLPGDISVWDAPLPSSFVMITFARQVLALLRLFRRPVWLWSDGSCGRPGGA